MVIWGPKEQDINPIAPMTITLVSAPLNWCVHIPLALSNITLFVGVSTKVAWHRDVQNATGTNNPRPFVGKLEIPQPLYGALRELHDMQ